MNYPDDLQEFFRKGGFAGGLTEKVYRHAEFRSELKVERDARESGYNDLVNDCRRNQRKKIKEEVVGA